MVVDELAWEIWGWCIKVLRIIYLGERRLLEKKYLCIDLREYRESILLEKNPSTLALALCVKMGWGRVVFIG